MPRIGYNINLSDLGARYEDALHSAKLANADFHLVMTVPQNGINGAGDIQSVTRWRDELSPARLVWRTYSTLEGDWIKMLGYTSTSAMLADSLDTFTDKCREWASITASRWHVEGLPDVIRDDPANEPGLNANDVQLNVRYVIRCVELQTACDFYGVQVAIGAFSVGTPHEELIDTGIYDPILRKAKYFSVHEYPAGMPGAGDLFEYERLLDPANYWQLLPRAIWSVDANYWLLRRCDRLYLRAKSLGNDVKFIITETNTSEDIPDAVHVNNQLKQRGYAIPDCGGDLRGHQAWRKYYEAVTGNNDFQSNVNRIMTYMGKYVFNVPHIVGVCLFTLGYSWGTGTQGRNRCHNYLGTDCDAIRKIYLPGLNKQLTQESDPVPLPDFNPALFDADVYVNSGYWNLRSEMSAGSADLGDITSIPERMKVSKETRNENGYDWYKFERDLATHTQSGYFAKTDKLVIDYIEETPDNEPVPDIGLPEIEDMIQKAIEPLLKESRVDFLATTFNVPEILRKPIGMALVAIGKELQTQGYRYAGITTASEIADVVYSTVTPDVSEVKETTLTDEILNGGDNA